ncbi:conserved hypothetical protein [Talaromyces stipitatus ATCC 10500]|uniref:Uncharacterized protein n=1 Tax=Talaromyces stipitatus (strain ATCC 10500 / CBS 375.48 / QM 6759 / NRRL 1006) TaxID=441959 RepID=B8MAQ7_TALSN|nr:uncharacterized protein TSTA_115450 [Talaromyces stipitatus ATCC 10500]EED17747.1 conserved hypothetical protein [Talaromyces stipitatus ATCC 10500]
MEASMVPEMSVKSAQHEPLHLHTIPPWKRYESEEEDVSETSSQSVFSPTEGDVSAESDADESVSDLAEYVDAEMLAPTYYNPSSDDSSSLYSNRLSIITAKRSSAATCVPNNYGQDTSTIDDNEDVSPLTDYMTPPVSPIYLSAVYYVPDGSESSSRDEADAEDNDEPEWHEVSEAKQVFFTAPTSKPSIIIIQNVTTEAILTARMGNPVENQQSTEQNVSDNLRKRSSTKRSSSASGMTTSPDRSKRYSAIFSREFTHNGEAAYLDSRNRTRAYSSQSPARNSSHPRTSRKDSNASTNTNSSERQQSRPRRNPSLRSYSRSSSRHTPDYEPPPNYSRPRSIRSSSVASDMTTRSSVSWKQVHTYNCSSSSSVVDHPTSSSPPPGENEPTKPTPHPLSIITTPTSPVTADFQQQQPRFTQSAITSHHTFDWSPVIEYRRSSTHPMQKTFPYSRLHNPSLSLSIATTPENLDLSRTRTRSGSMAPTTTSTTQKPFISTATSSTTSKSSNHSHSSSTMRLLMGGFRGLGKQRSHK